MVERFAASTKYNDFVGTVAADRSDELDFSALLKKRGLIGDDEYLIGFEVVFNENGGSPIPNPGIVAYLGRGRGVDGVTAQQLADGIIDLRPVEVFDLPVADFFRYFKRFKLLLSNSNVKLDRTEYRLVE